MQLSAFFSIWHKPKEILRCLHQSKLSHHQLILILTLVYFIQIGTFILSLEKITLAPLFTWDGLQLIVGFFVSVGLWSFVLTYLLTLTLWIGAKCFRGAGTLPQTRGAVIWTLISTLPIGFFFLLTYFAFSHPNLGSFSTLLRIVSYLGIFATLIYGFNILIKTLAEIHRLRSGQAFAASLMGLILIGAMLLSSKSYWF